MDGGKVTGIEELAAESGFEGVGCVEAVGPEAIGGVELERAVIVVGILLAGEGGSVVGGGVGVEGVGDGIGVRALGGAFAVVPDTLSQCPVGGEDVAVGALVIEHRLRFEYMLLESRFAYVGAVCFDARIETASKCPGFTVVQSH